VAFGRAILDYKVLPFDVAAFGQPIEEAGLSGVFLPGWQSRKGRAEQADHRHRLLLSVSEERPARNAVEQCDEIPPLHVVFHA
jgi:hypothetical protein